MINSIIDTFINLDEPNKNKVLNIISKFINPIKLYLVVVILLLLIMCILNFNIYRQLYNFSNIKGT